MPGSTVTFGAGTFDREVADNGAGSGSLFYVRGRHAAIVNDRWFPDLTPDQALREINLPSKHLVNAGVTYVAPRWFGTLSASGL